MGLNIGITNDFLLSSSSVPVAQQKYILWAKARQGGSPGLKPSLDLDFARNKSLIDNVTGQNLVDFTRASSGTYVDSEGVIRTATTNLLLRSEEFDNASWTASNGSVTANADQSPNGTLSADKFIPNTSNIQHQLFQPGWPASGSATFSVYGKSAGYGFLVLRIVQLNTNVWFDLDSGVVGTTGAGISASIIPAGNGWYRCVATATSSGSGNIAIEAAPSDNVRTFSGDGTSGIYLWGAQLEQSTTVGEYIPTTSTINSAPRFDHDPTTGESLGLLVEVQRTNLLLWSEEFDDESWSTTRSSVTANNQAAPNGTVTADTLTADGTADFPNAIAQNTGGFSAAGDKTISAFIKKGTNNFVQIYTAGNVNVFANFDLNTGTIGTVGTQCTAAIASVGNGWYRCVVTTSQTNPTSISFNIVTSSTAPRAQVGGTSNSIYLWGAQLEVGSFPTSYIPTTGATATRAADVASISGSNFSSWYNATQGSIFVEPVFSNTVSYNTVYCLGDGTDSNRTRTIQWNNGTNRPLVVDSGGVAQVGITGTGGTGAFKFAVGLQQDNFAVSQKGETPSTDTCLR